MIHRNIKLRLCLVCKTITTCEKRQATRALNLPINLWSYRLERNMTCRVFTRPSSCLHLPPQLSSLPDVKRRDPLSSARHYVLVLNLQHTHTPLPVKGMRTRTPLHEKIETCMLWPCALLHEKALYSCTQTYTITHTAGLRAIICHPGDEFTVVLSPLQAPTSGIPLEIYVRAAVVSSACIRTLKTTPPRELWGGSNPLYTSSQLLEGFWICVCVHHFLCLWAAVKAVNADCFTASTMCLQLHDFLSAWL